MRAFVAPLAALVAVAALAGCSSPPAAKPTPAPKPSTAVSTATPTPAENRPAAAEGPLVQLYTFRVGEVSASDMGLFSDTGEYDGQPGQVVCTCYLVRHPKGTLLWDTGLPDALADQKDAKGPVPGIVMKVTTKLVDQLATLKLEPKDVTYVAFSHLHGDHTGNANLFTSSEWILNRAELAWGLAQQGPGTVDTKSWSSYSTVKQKLIDGDLDVFGDGSVRILKAPGHTPGHQVLLVRLRETGPVLLSGDLWHIRANHEHRRVPTFNVDRAQTLASFDRIDTIMKNTGARLVVQHDPEDVKLLPVVPEGLK
jgi:glyoxylase-like metal-dependent hydrolase (beta-lactamase superfamily II)